MTARAAFKQDDVARAVKGAIDGGMKPGRVEVTLSPEGTKITIVEGGAASGPAAPNPWDDELDGQEN